MKIFNYISHLCGSVNILKSSTSETPISEPNYIKWNPIIIYLVLFPSLMLFFVPFLLRPTIYSGDEPHYLLVANSFLKYGSMDLRQIYSDARLGSSDAGFLFRGITMNHHTQLVDNNAFPNKCLGDWHDFFSDERYLQFGIPRLEPPKYKYVEYSNRGIAWPFFIAAASFFTNLKTEFAAKILSHLAVLLTGIFVFLTLRSLKCRREISLLSSISLCLGSSYWIYANTVFAESLLGACLACSLYALFTGNAILLGVALSLGAWMKFQFIVPSMAIFVMGLILVPPGHKIRLTVTFAVGILSFLAFNFFYYGQMEPPMVMIPGNPLKALFYFFLNPQTTIILRNPWVITIVGLFGIAHTSLNKVTILALFSALFFVFAPPLFVAYYDGGYCYPCRLIQPVLIILVILLGLVLQHAGSILRSVSIGLVTMSILINLIAAISNPQLTWTPSWIWMQVFLNHLS